MGVVVVCGRGQLWQTGHLKGIQVALFMMRQSLRGCGTKWNGIFGVVNGGGFLFLPVAAGGGGGVEELGELVAVGGLEVLLQLGKVLLLLLQEFK